jgi:hypothetical protein
VESSVEGERIVVSRRRERPRLVGRFARSDMAARLLQARATEVR